MLSTQRPTHGEGTSILAIIHAHTSTYNHTLIALSPSLRIYKALIDFFDKKKKKVTVETNRSSAATMDLVVEDGEDYEGEDADLADILAASETPQERAIREAADVGQSAVDDHAISMTRARAVRDMAAQGVVISAAQQQSAIKIFPKVSQDDS